MTLMAEEKRKNPDIIKNVINGCRKSGRIGYIIKIGTNGGRKQENSVILKIAQMEVRKAGKMVTL
jgi:hypothetical protein